VSAPTLSTWRRRAVAAEERAFAAERSLKRARSTLATLRADLAEAIDGCEQVVAQSRAQRRTLRRLAACHLGGGVTDGEVTQLIIRWMTEDQKQEERERAAAAASFVAHMDRLFGLRREDDNG
jgi:hypothetical protein